MNAKEVKVLHYAARTGQLGLVKFLVEEKGYRVDMQDEMGCTALFYAAHGNHLEVMKYLITKGANGDTVVNVCENLLNRGGTICDW